MNTHTFTTEDFNRAVKELKDKLASKESILIYPEGKEEFDIEFDKFLKQRITK